MIVRLLKPWKYRKVGTILAEVPDGAANMLVRRGFAEEVLNVDLSNHAASRISGPDVRAAGIERGEVPVRNRPRR
jgi:hypothetical protein